MIELDQDEVSAQLARRAGRRAGMSADPASLIVPPPGRVIAVASGKGGVGKSTIAANLAVLAAAHGLRVGLLDADLHGFSAPRLLGVTGQPVKAHTPNGGRALMAPVAHGVKVISVGMFTDNHSPVVWRGPVAHRALTQFLGETQWGNLDLLLVDLPPGTGDVAISIANLLPAAELLVVTTPQLASAEVAARAGAMARHTGQMVVGVVENLAWLPGPGSSRTNLFGVGGGQQVAARLEAELGYPVPLAAEIPIEPKMAQSGDMGEPIVLFHPESPGAQALSALYAELDLRKTPEALNHNGEVCA